MPTKDDRRTFGKAIKDKNQDQIRALLQRDDAKELLLMKDDYGYLLIHDVCWFHLDSLALIVDASAEHGIAKQMLESKSNNGLTCLHAASSINQPADSFRVLLEYLTKHTDIKKILEEKTIENKTCLHDACRNKLPAESFRLLVEYLSKYADIKKVLEEKTVDHWSSLHYACANSLSVDSLRFLVAYYPSKEIFENVLGSKNQTHRTPADYAEKKVEKLLQDSECWQKSRLWLLQNHEDIFLTTLHPNSFEKTCEALKELTKNGLQHSHQQSTVMLIAFMSSAVKFREAVNNTDSTAPMEDYFDVVKKGDKKSDYDHWRKNFSRFREFYGQWPPSERKMAPKFEGEGSSSSCSIQ